MGNFVADVMRAKYAASDGVDAAYTNSGACAPDLLMSPPSSGGEAVGEITWGEAFAVLPFGNATALITLTGPSSRRRSRTASRRCATPSINTGRFPAVSGLRATYQCNGTTAVVTGMWKTPDGHRRSPDPDRARPTPSGSSPTTSC